MSTLTPVIDIDPDAAVQSFNSDTCPACSQFKPRRKSLCRDCYYEQHRDVRHILATHTGQKYYDALARALQHLNCDEMQMPTKIESDAVHQ